jgi:crossover junction endodeoxyribonuclease RusA
MTFTVIGIPAAQGSKRMVRARGGRTLLIEQSTRVKPWRAAVAAAARAAGCTPRDGDCAVTVSIRLSRPAAHYKADGTLRTGLPRFPRRIDIDKAARAVLDALTGVAYLDDRQVQQLDIDRVWYAEGGALISVDFIEGT